MFTPATPLYSALGTLKGPTTTFFDPDAWRAIVGDDGDQADQRLLRSALWIADQASAVRDQGDKAKLLEVGGRQSAILAVAAMNREMLCIMRDRRKARSDDDAGLAFDHIVSRPTLETGSGALAAPDDVIEMAVGVAESWLYDSYLQPIEGQPSELSIEALILGGGRIYSLQRNHNDLWNQARWDGWGLDPSGTRWQPADREFSTLEDSWRARSQANTMSHAWLIVTEWKQYTPRHRRNLALRRTVESIQRSPRSFKIKIARPSDLSLRKPAHYALDRASLDGSYLASLVDDDFPKVPGLNAHLLLKAWHVLNDLAKRMMAGLDDSRIADRLEDFALLVRRQTLNESLVLALDIGPDIADTIIDFLTYRTSLPGGKGQRGLWAAPLVEIPGSDAIGLAAPALISSFILRKAEAWLERGGIDDQLGKQSRGEALERDYRTRLAQSVAGNVAFQAAVVAPHGVKKSKSFPQQIDLMFRLGGLLIVAEVKHRLFPSESLERYNYFQNLKGAAQQAKLKAAAIEAQPEVAAAALGLPVETIRHFRVLPLVVVNQGFGLGLLVDDVRVTETAFLDSLLSSQEIVTGMSFDQFTGERLFATDTLYRNEQDLVDRFETILADPFVLRRFISRMGWRTYDFPQAGGGSIQIEAPVLGDVSGPERTRAEQARDYFEARAPRPRGRGR